MDKKVLLIGLDGVRPDTIRVANTPNIDTLARNGQYSWNAQTEKRTVSGPTWTSLLTGVHVEKHNVWDNEFDERNHEYETIFTLAKRWNPALKTVAHSNWKPIICDIFEKGSLDKQSSGSDEKMALIMAKDIRDGQGDLYFIQLDEVDAAGHDHTYGPDSAEYVKRIEKTDELIGHMLREVEGRPEHEEWFIGLVSDHGGTEKKHGGITLEELTIAFVVSGNAVKEKGEIPSDEENVPEIVDMVPSIACFIGIPSEDYWDGRSRWTG